MKKLLLILLSLFILTGCPKEKPPIGNEPLPALDGEYISDIGTLYFKGDGESIVFEFNDEYKEKLNLSVNNKGTYVFSIDHRGECDYDKANLFRIFVDDTELSFQIPIGETNFDKIVVFTDEGSLDTISFERKK